MKKKVGIKNDFFRRFYFARGFTVLELLLVIVIISFLSLMTVSFYSRFINQNAASNTVDQLVGSLRKAQTYAMAGRQNNNWGVYYGNSQIVLFAGNTYAGRVTGFDESFDVPSSVAVSGFTQMYYSRITGLPSASQLITVSSGNTSKTVTVNLQGVVSK